MSVKHSSPSEPPLQPLRIPTGWNVDWNTFFEIDPPFRSYDQASWNFGEDMLHLGNKFRGVAIDLGWLPAHQARGRYVLRAVRLYDDADHGWTADWDRPLRELKTRSRRKVVAAIEDWLRWYSDHPPRPRRTANKVRCPRNATSTVR